MPRRDTHAAGNLVGVEIGVIEILQDEILSTRTQGAMIGAVILRLQRSDGGCEEIESRAQVPLSELKDYAAELKGATAGRGRYDLEFSHYEPVPPPVQKQLVEAFKPHHEED